MERSEGDPNFPKTSPISQHVKKMRRQQLTHPVSDVQEALLAGEIEHQQEPHGIPEERRCQAAEPGTHVKKFFFFFFFFFLNIPSGEKLAIWQKKIWIFLIPVTT